ncbi:MAG: tetratricopeptide repeat protein [Methylovulum sp.]|uniref:tetratricopeptide repeat protein n=1 Tax=Methylovulum sp. TaxID=1916980 RepID=UPI00262EEC06|nr:tetratricopeptide repeat protein [Methylovulum sp.]MDD2722956.1 tetratricopeptide repeat protein [Methylovulum sp.]MDD5123269.1 tetratricopeptide repeat protein [Methylovulum sp.]
MKNIIKGLLLVSVLSIATAWAEEAVQEDLVQAAAIQGDAKAQAKLGAMYLLGNGQEKDEQQAAEWLLKAAAQGYLDAQVLVAALYDRGIGVKSDVKTATEWYEKAAAQGHTASLAILGKNPVAAGGVAFSYQKMRLNAAKQIPTEYAKKILLTK